MQICKHVGQMFDTYQNSRFEVLKSAENGVLVPQGVRILYSPERNKLETKFYSEISVCND